MKKAPQTRVAGVGTALGAVFLGSVMMLGCQPGVLPCEKDDWKGICAGSDSGVNLEKTGGSGGTTAGNSGGSSGGSGGSSGGSGGAPAAGGKPTAATTVADCGNYKTLGEMDTFFEMKCGSGPNGGSGCHGSGAPFGDFKGNKMWERGTTTMTKFDCKGTLLIDPTDYTKGAFFMKLNGDAKCGGAALKMPPPNATADQMVSDAEKKCLENYFKAVSGK